MLPTPLGSFASVSDWSHFVAGHEPVDDFPPTPEPSLIDAPPPREPPTAHDEPNQEPQATGPRTRDAASVRPPKADHREGAVGPRHRLSFAPSSPVETEARSTQGAPCSWKGDLVCDGRRAWVTIRVGMSKKQLVSRIRTEFGSRVRPVAILTRTGTVASVEDPPAVVRALCDSDRLFGCSGLLGAPHRVLVESQARRYEASHCPPNRATTWLDAIRRLLDWLGCCAGGVAEAVEEEQRRHKRM